MEKGSVTGDIGAAPPDATRKVEDAAIGEIPSPNEGGLVASVFAGREPSAPMDSTAAPMQDLQVKEM
ncbi:MAG: hypothetical protein LBI61_00070 [Puniceicoccales bacterium]|jgi:hypothetical protein|nr:hypothetical protein [Puniceicoccales bacterium]